MKIGELAQRTGLSASRIRFYEHAGLLKSVSRQANGYRVYPAETVATLEIIVRAQQAGFSLDEIRNLIPADFSKWEHKRLLHALRRKIADIETMEKRLLQCKEHLQRVIQSIENRPAGISCAENTMRVLKITR
jgi:DNA-binding transcriptional MerR regulator